MKTKSYLLSWFIFTISIFILDGASFINIKTSFLYSQELQPSLILKNGNSWIEIKQGDIIYVRSYNEKIKPNKLPGSTIGSFTSAKPSKFVGLDLQNRILVTEFDYIYLSNIHSISISSSKTMAFEFAANNFTHGFLAGTIFPLILFLSEGGENPMALIIFAGFFGTFVGVPSAAIGLIHGLAYPNIENEFIVGQNDWIIVEE